VENYKLGSDRQKLKDVRINGGINPVAAYFFDENGGDMVLDRAAGDDPLNLLIPGYIKERTKPFLSFPENSLLSSRNIDHFIMNVMIFIPFGLFLYAILIIHYRATVWIFLSAVSLSALFILTVESLQFLSLTRDSSLFDVCANIIGSIIGIILFSFHHAHLKRNQIQIGT